MTSEPSEVAVDAATQARADGLSERVALAAAHDPRLGLDRSVRLGDVVKWLQEYQPRSVGEQIVGQDTAALAIVREFGGG